LIVAREVNKISMIMLQAFSVIFPWSHDLEEVTSRSVLLLLFFSLDLGFFCFIWGSAVFVENQFFLLWSKFRNVCCITVDFIKKYSSFIGVMCRVSSQYTWV